jgi:hypothetical protein
LTYKDIGELGSIDVFVDGPKAINFLKVIKIHPKDTIVTVTIEANSLS